MPVRIRLQRQGRKKRPFYHIVVADSRVPRDGRFVERLGYYDPLASPSLIQLDTDKVIQWLQKGAQPTGTVRALLAVKGVLYKLHLMRGIKKGILTEQDAETKFTEWLKQKEEQLRRRELKKQMKKQQKRQQQKEKQLAKEVKE